MKATLGNGCLTIQPACNTRNPSKTDSLRKHMRVWVIAERNHPI